MGNFPLTTPTSSLMQRVPSTSQRSQLDEGIRRIRNRLRKYSARSVVEAALQELWSDRGSRMENLRAAPWISMLLVKWALADRMTHINIGGPIPQAVFDQLRQAVWDLPEWTERAPTPTTVMAMLRPMLQQQLEFQRPQGWGFMRWPALIARRPATDAISQRFRQALAMDPDTYIDLGWGLSTSSMHGKPRILDTYFAPLRAHYGDSVDRMVGLFTRDLAALREELAKPEAQTVQGRAELREFAYLRRFPFVRLDPAAIVCWHPAVLARGLEDAVHLRLSDFGEQYTRPFSKIFESYVIELSVEAVPAAITERAYMSTLDPQQPKVEVLLQEAGCNILIEAKMSLFKDSVLVTDNAESIYFKTERVREGIKQGWNVSRALEQPGNPFHRPGVVENFLIVVTSRQLFLGTGRQLAELYPAGKLAYSDADSERLLPLDHVFIVSIDEFERACACVRAGKVTFQEMLRKAVADNADPPTRKLFMSQHLDEYPGKLPRPALIEDVIRASRARLALLLPEN